MRKPTIIGFIPKKVVKKVNKNTDAENATKTKNTDAENTENSEKENSEE